MRKRLLGLILALAACNSAGLTNPAGPGASSSGDPVDPEGDDDSGAPVGDAAPRDGATPADVPTTHDVTIQVIPGDKGQAILDAVKGAKTSVHMTMYLLTDSRFITALGDLKTAGKDVKVILNQNFPSGFGSESGADNVDAYNKLMAKGVDVKWAPAGYQYTHAKTIVIDSKSLFVMTMNLTFSSPTSNREFIATDTDADDVKVAEDIFAADHADQSKTVTTKLLLSPQSATAVDARQRMIALINSATATLEVAGETLSDTQIVNAFIAAKNAGVQVKIVIDQSTGTDAQKTAIANLKAAGVPIKSLGNPDMHAKAIVADGKKAYVGSQNFTTNSLFSNREVGLVTDAAAGVKTIQDTIAQDFANGSAL